MRSLIRPFSKNASKTTKKSHRNSLFPRHYWCEAMLFDLYPNQLVLRITCGTEKLLFHDFVIITSLKMDFPLKAIDDLKREAELRTAVEKVNFGKASSQSKPLHLSPCCDKQWMSNEA
ncbi:hypothetical protein TNCV_1801531 [Trichonephila clavipes]|nr:hypothetical protein TNCV_1801531 [Trichonephila clavipes]